jgi:hypothetical protein
MCDTARLLANVLFCCTVPLVARFLCTVAALECCGIVQASCWWANECLHRRKVVTCLLSLSQMAVMYLCYGSYTRSFKCKDSCALHGAICVHLSGVEGQEML